MVQSLQRSHPFRITLEAPELLEVQRSGFSNFLQRGIGEELSKMFPLIIENNKIIIELTADIDNFKLIYPEENALDCVLKMKTYSCKLYIEARVVCKTISGKMLYQSKPKWVLLGNLPMMTKRGHFIVNGSSRVIVHQVVRSPGIYFHEITKNTRKTRFDEGRLGKARRFYGDLIPEKGFGVRLQLNKKRKIEIKAKKGKKVEALFFLRCLRVIEKQERPTFWDSKTSAPSSFNLFFASKTNKNSLLSTRESVKSLPLSGARSPDPGPPRREGYPTGGVKPLRQVINIYKQSTKSLNQRWINDIYFSPQHRSFEGDLSKASGYQQQLTRSTPTRTIWAENSSGTESAGPPYGNLPYGGVRGSGSGVPQQLEHSLSSTSGRTGASAFLGSGQDLDASEREDCRAVLDNPNLSLNKSKCLSSGKESSNMSRYPILSTASYTGLEALSRNEQPSPLQNEGISIDLITEDEAFGITYEKLYQSAAEKEKLRLEKKEYREMGIRGVPTPSTPPKGKRGITTSKNLFQSFQVTPQYDLGKLGRERINAKFGIFVTERYLTTLDIEAITLWLEGLKTGINNVDDIDHSENRRVRSSGELIQNQFKNGVDRLKSTAWSKIKELSILVDESSTYSDTRSRLLLNKPGSNAYISLTPAGITPSDFDDVQLQDEPKAGMLKYSYSNSIQAGRRKRVVDKKIRSSSVDQSSIQLSTRARSIRLNKVKPNWATQPSIRSTSVDQSLIPSKKEQRGVIRKGMRAFDIDIVNGTSYGDPFSSAKLKLNLNYVQAAMRPRIPPVGGVRVSGIQVTGTESAGHPYGNPPLRVIPPVRGGPGSGFSRGFRKRFEHSSNRLKKSVIMQIILDRWGLSNFDTIASPYPNTQLAAGISDNRSSTFKESSTHTDESFYDLIAQVKEIEKDILSVNHFLNGKAINGALREFFGSNPLSQYMDQTNPLAEITHKRRISSLGVGGVTRESAGMAIRGIHPTQYGRICPIETPEGKNAGLVNSLAFYARMDTKGFIKTPYYKVIKGQVQQELGFSFFSAKEEKLDGLHVAPTDLRQSWNDVLGRRVPVRVTDKVTDLFEKISSYKADSIGISPIQMISAATSLIPFLEHNDANRALMGSNMQRQAVPLLIPERAIVGTGLESLVVGESGHVTQSQLSGFISHVSANSIVVEYLCSSTYTLGYTPQLVNRPITKKQANYLLPKGLPLAAVGPRSPDSSRRGELPVGGVLRVNRVQATGTSFRNRVQVTGTSFRNPRVEQTFKTQNGLIGGNLLFFDLSERTEYAYQARLHSSSSGSKNSIQVKYAQALSQDFTGDLVAEQSEVKQSPEAKQGSSKRKLNLNYVQAAMVPEAGSRTPDPPLQGGLPVGGGYPTGGVTHRVTRFVDRYTNPLKGFNHYENPDPTKKGREVESLFRRIGDCNILLPFNHKLNTFNRSNQETCLTERALVKEGDWVHEGDILTDCSASEKGELAVGKNLLIAYIPWEGYNFEDAIVISERLVTQQLYTSLHIERYDYEAQHHSKDKEEWFTKHVPFLRSKCCKHLDAFGLPRIGSFVKEGDILVGKVMRLKNRDVTPYERLLSDILERKPTSRQDTSVRVPRGIQGRVVNCRVIGYFPEKPEVGSERPAGKQPKVVHVFLGEKRAIQVGDKMSGRHGNKGVVSTILPIQDMPYLPDGTPIDMILNPLGVPSRMNVGQVYECLLGLAGTYLAQHFKITAFDELYGEEASQSVVFLKLYQARLQSGQSWLFQVDLPGKTRLIDGRSGETFDQWITVGRAYMLKLIHMVDEKIHARATGPYALVTQQPLRGRSKKGGQRLGEMEVWALEGFGAAYILQEVLTKKSDDMIGRQEVVPSILPQSIRYQHVIQADFQPLVQKQNRLILGNPEIFKVLVCELQALCLDIGVYHLTKESFQRRLIDNTGTYA